MTREFIFLPDFEKQWKSFGLDDDNLRDLEAYLCEYPEAGKLIQKTGGLRKFRWKLPSKGKSGGARILYVDFSSYEKLYLIACFSKSTKISLTGAEKAILKAVIEEIKKTLRSKEL